MNEKIRIRRASLKTPRISGQQSNGQIGLNLNYPQSKNVFPYLPQSDSNYSNNLNSNQNINANTFISLKHSYNVFSDELSHFISKYGASLSQKLQNPQLIQEMERLFNTFVQTCLKVIQSQNSSNKANPSVKATGIPFLKCWQMTALELYELRKANPYQSNQSIQTHFKTIFSSLNVVMTNGISRSSKLEKFNKNGQILQNQLNVLKEMIDNFTDTSNGFKVANKLKDLKLLSNDLKKFSTVLNDTFTKEFTQCGIAQKEVVRLRTRCYAACCDIIQCLQKTYIFQTDINKIFRSIYLFQTEIRDIIVYFGLPTTYLISFEYDEINENEKTNNSEDSYEENENIDIENLFDENLDLVNFIQDSYLPLMNFTKNKDVMQKFYELLLLKAQTEINCYQSMGNEIEARIKSEYNTKFVTEIENERKQITKELTDKFLHNENLIKKDLEESHTLIKNLQDKISEKSFESNNIEQVLLIRIEKFQNALIQLCKTNEINSNIPDEDDDAIINKAIEKNNDLKQEIYELTKKIEEFHNKEDTAINKLKEDVNKYQNSEQEIKILFSNISSLESITDIADEINGACQKLKFILTEQGYQNEQNSISEIVDLIFMFIQSIKNSIHKILGNNKPQKNILELLSIIEYNYNNTLKCLNETFQNSKTDIPLYELTQNVVEKNKNYVQTFRTIFTMINKQLPECSIETEVIKSLQHTFEQFSNKLSEINCTMNNKALISPVEQVEQHISVLKKNIQNDKQMLKEYQTLCNEVETELSSYCNSASSNTNKQNSNNTRNGSNIKTIRILLKKLPSKQNNQINNAGIKDIEKKLCKIVQCKETPDKKNVQNHINEVIELIISKMKKNDEFKEAIESKLQLKNATYEKILSTISSISSKNSDLNSRLNQLFGKFFKIIEVTSQSDPSVFVPEIYDAFNTLNESINALRPFASILNNVFNQFDCKYPSFNPVNKQYQLLRKNIYALHSALNNVSASNVNSVVFLVLSRFTALISSFSAAISAASFDERDEKMKSKFYEMEMELSRGNKPNC